MGLTTMPQAVLVGTGVPPSFPAGTLVLVTGAMPFRIRGRLTVAVETLLEQMALDGCIGLVVSAAPGVHQPFPQSIRDLSERIQIPLLVTSAPGERWDDAYASIQRERLALAERRASQLNALVQQLPAQLADQKALQRISDWLAHALDVQVLVSEPERVLAASPATAAEHLAHAIIRQSVEGGIPAGPSDVHTQLISLAPASGTETVLAVSRRSRFDETDIRLLRHAAKLMGLVDQARREYRTAATASHAARIAAVELLLDGELDKARRVMMTLAPGMLDSDTARAFVIDAPHTRVNAIVRRCEIATAGNALVVADPRDRNRILVIHPVRPGERDDRTATELTCLVAGLGSDASLGGSGIYSLSMLADAVREAITAQRLALHQPDSVTLSVQDTDVISLLSPHEAHRWARSLLQPLMQTETQWAQYRETLPTALAYPYTVAARRLGLHRNTVTRRVARAAELLNKDFTAVTDRIAVGLALELVTHRSAPDLSTDSVGADEPNEPTLDALLAAPQVYAWADRLLSSARVDRRDLLTTATTWLTVDAHLEPTARLLGLSEVTIRSHIRALEGYISRDLSSLNGMRDLQIALHVTGDPSIPTAGRKLCAA